MLTTIRAIAGLLVGLSGLILSVLNYRRERAKVLVSFHPGRVMVLDRQGHQAKLDQIHLTNAGRRPVYIVAAGVILFTLGQHVIRRTTTGGVKGRRLAEGDPPMSLVVPDSVEMAKFLWQEHAGHWRYIRAFAEDGTGRRYLSPRFERRPFWGVGDGEIDLGEAEKMIQWEFECNLEQHELENLLNQGKWHVYPLEQILAMQQATENTQQGDTQ